MFGLTEHELQNYRKFTYEFAVAELAPQIVSNSKIMAPALRTGDKVEVDRMFLNQLLSDIETVITLTAFHMAYEYAYLQCDSDYTESEIIQLLHKKFEDHVFTQFVTYGVTFALSSVTQIVSGIILELPYLYGMAIEDEDFDPDEFLEEKLEAYNKYMNESFSTKNTESSEDDEEDGLDDMDYDDDFDDYDYDDEYIYNEYDDDYEYTDYDWDYEDEDEDDL